MKNTGGMVPFKIGGIGCFLLPTMTPDPDDVGFEVYDRRGYPAAWLEIKMTDPEEQRAVEAVEKYLHDNREEP